MKKIIFMVMMVSFFSLEMQASSGSFSGSEEIPSTQIKENPSTIKGIILDNNVIYGSPPSLPFNTLSKQQTQMKGYQDDNNNDDILTLTSRKNNHSQMTNQNDANDEGTLYERYSEQQISTNQNNHSNITDQLTSIDIYQVRQMVENAVMNDQAGGLTVEDVFPFDYEDTRHIVVHKDNNNVLAVIISALGNKKAATDACILLNLGTTSNLILEKVESYFKNHNYKMISVVPNENNRLLYEKNFYKGGLELFKNL